MAERRMFAKTIIDSDAFLEMPQSSQLLYFHLAMRADDDGFVNKPKTILRMVGCKDDDMTVLIAKKFIIPFDSGIVVIKHWKIHNYIQKDRYMETKYKEEKAQLALDENKSYTTCIQNGYTTDTQVRDRLEIELGKDRLDKSIDDSCESTPTPKSTKHKYGQFKNVLLTEEEYQKLIGQTNGQLAIDRLSWQIAEKGYKAKSHYLSILRWCFKAVEEENARNAKSSQDKKSVSTGIKMMTGDN